jgi:hypothetical protein
MRVGLAGFVWKFAFPVSGNATPGLVSQEQLWRLGFVLKNESLYGLRPPFPIRHDVNTGGDVVVSNMAATCLNAE